jgi:hypothetical protein
MHMDQTAPTGKTEEPETDARRSPRVTLPEPVPVDSWWRNRRHEAVVSKLYTLNGRNIFDIRIHEMQNGRLVPTRKGVAIVVLRLIDLQKSITKAVKKARELGLIDDSGRKS